MGQHVNLFVPKQAVGSNLVYFDLFNAAGSGHDLIIKSVEPVVSGAVAVTGVISVDLLLTFTSAVGTGGTAATRRGTAIDAATFTTPSSRGGVNEVPALITARLTPSGGATAAAIISWTTVFSEETNAGTYTRTEMVNRDAFPYVMQGGGIRVVQGATASVGNIGFNVLFEMVPAASA